MTDHQLDIITITHLSFFIPEPKTARKTAHKLHSPPRHLGRHGNVRRVAGCWLFDFHAEKLNAAAVTQQGEERMSKPLVLTLLGAAICKRRCPRYKMFRRSQTNRHNFGTAWAKLFGLRRLDGALIRDSRGKD